MAGQGFLLAGGLSCFRGMLYWYIQPVCHTRQINLDTGPTIYTDYTLTKSFWLKPPRFGSWQFKDNDLCVLIVSKSVVAAMITTRERLEPGTALKYWRSLCTCKFKQTRNPMTSALTQALRWPHYTHHTECRPINSSALHSPTSRLWIHVASWRVRIALWCYVNVTLSCILMSPIVHHEAML